jgi:DNA primase
VIWPIRDQSNSVIGFGARKIFEDDNGPKYLNTSDTPVYHKSQVLYGIDLAKREIAKQQQVVVVEGYTDVMACHLAGVTTAVATCGTAFGDEHIRILNRILSNDPANPAKVIFNFDPDEAGQKAAMRAFNDASKFNAQTFMAIGPDGLDPSDLRTKRGDEAVVAVGTDGERGKRRRRFLGGGHD